MHSSLSSELGLDLKENEIIRVEKNNRNLWCLFYNRMINALISFCNNHVPEVLAKNLGEAQELIQTTWGPPFPPEDPPQLGPSI